MTPPREATASGLAAEAGWVGPLVATLLLQIATAFLSRLIPTVAPVLAAEFRWSEAMVGYLSAANTFGSIAFLMCGNPLIRRTGPIRALQVGLLLGIGGLALLAAPLAAAALIASFLIGLGYGPSPPAGSDVLQRYAPARHRNLVFSIKQAGVPVGGVIAGLALPPIAAFGGWRATLVFAAALALATILIVQPLRGRIDSERNRHEPLGFASFFSPVNLARPIASLAAAPGLTRMALAGACFAIGQGCWFAFLVTYLVAKLDYSLATAGLVFAVMQATGVFGRILLGWVSDRIGSGLLTLRLVAVTSAATSLALAFTGSAWSVWWVIALAGVGGVTVSSWNGVQIAETARLAPRQLVAETTAGATVLIFLGYIAGPALFAVMVEATGRFDLCFAGVAAATLLALPILARNRPG